ncbi:MAG: SCP2 sterol-binding domain-containing protein [Pseudomonadales bacterium]|nr:SCP2 sterol-binding domain-containing protein [Pseudomonadales bacterium]MCP5203665.1 SCP2 sterol-binding domain-containing protein [Pseudomonadales bacterium]
MAAALDPALQTALLAALESTLNRALALAPGSGEKLAALGDCVFALHCQAPPLDVFLLPGGDRLRLMGVYDGPVTTSVSGVASDFAELLTSTDPAAKLINGRLELRGDSAPLIELQKILAALEVDWEAPLVDTLGDVAGHQLAQVLRAAWGWGRQASGSLGRQLEEFIHEEARLSPPRLELEDFYRDVQQLGLRVERLESRARRLRKRLQQLHA